MINPFRMFAKAKPAKSTKPQLFGTNYYSGEDDPNVEYQHPDDLPKQKGIGIYREMVDRDDMVATGYSYLQMASLSTGSQIEPGVVPDMNEALEAKAQEAADYATHALESIQGAEQQAYLLIMDAGPLGFVVIEKVWAKPETEGLWIGKQGFSRLAHKNQEYIKFNLDEFGQIRDKGIWQETMSGGYNKFSREDVIYWAFDPRGDNPYGRTPSRRAYRFFWVKDNVIRNWARYMERYGFPIVEGVYPKGSGATDKATLAEILKKMRTSLTFSRQADWEVKIHSVQAHYAQTNLYGEALTVCNRSIARALGLPALVVEHEGQGSYALGKEHNDQFVWILNYHRSACEDVVNEQMIKPLVGWNFAPGTPMPMWRLKPFAEDDLQAKVEMAKIIHEMGFPISKKKLAELSGVPLPAEGEEVLPARAGGAPREYQIPGMDEEEAADLTEMAWDAAHGDLKPERTLVQMGRGNGKKNPDWLKAVEAHCNFAEQKIDEDIAVEYWGEVAGLHFEKVANDLAEQAGKELGARPLR